jgi:CubicO group peptidase (beta-lactamase class C family)
MTQHNATVQIQGHIEPGFERVQTLFENNMRQWAEEHAQLCVYHKGRKVVDLWGSKGSPGSFHADSLVNVFSSGKSLEAIALAHLAGQGLIDYETPISKYWPEFAQNGKDQVTVADLMRHEAGLANFDFSIPPTDLHTPNIKADAIGSKIAPHPQHYSNKEQTRREYHALTRGWIANELFRRVEPNGRTIGEFIRDEISAPLDADVAIGVDEEQFTKRVPIKPLPVLKHLLATLRPRILGRRVFHNTLQLFARLSKLVMSLVTRPQKKWPIPFEGMTGIAFFNEKSVAMGETPSANTSASARGLAKIAAAMASRGTMGEQVILPNKGWDLLHRHPIKDNMGGFLPCEFTQGGVNYYSPLNSESSKLEKAFNSGREGFYGWMGLGGSLFQWHPEHEIGFAFVPTSLHMLDLLNERGKEYQAEVLRCIWAKGTRES